MLYNTYFRHQSLAFVEQVRAFAEGLLGKNKRLGYYGSLPATITDKV